MSSSVHQLVILPNGQTNVYCKDGLSPLDVMHIDSIFNFGGKMNFVDCGAVNHWTGLEQAVGDMVHHINALKIRSRKSNVWKDLNLALKLDIADINKF